MVRAARAVASEDNPAGVVYGTIVAGALLAAEAPRHETLPETVGAVAISVAMYWVAHTYAHNTGSRVLTDAPLTLRTLARSAVHELKIVAGALVPLVVLLAAWAVGARTPVAVRAAVVSSVAVLVVVEVAAGLQSSRRPTNVVVSVVVSLLLGLGVLVVNALLH